MRFNQSQTDYDGTNFTHRQVTIERSDILEILWAASELIRNLANVPVSIVNGIIGSICRAAVASNPNTSSLALPLNSTLLKVSSEGRYIYGFMLEESISFQHSGQQFNLPLNLITNIDVRRSGFFGSGDAESISVRLVDGSSFWRVNWVQPDNFRIASIAGIQSVDLFTIKTKTITTERWFGFVQEQHKQKYRQLLAPQLKTCTIKDAAKYGIRLKAVLSHNFESILDTIGEDVLNNYFDADEIRDAQKSDAFKKEVTKLGWSTD